MQYRDPRGIPSREEELELIGRAQAGDTDARDELLLRHYGFVRSIARRFARNGDASDYTQVAALEFLERIGDFDLDSGNRYSTYAIWWIWQALQKHQAGLRIVYVPAWVTDGRTLPEARRASTVRDRAQAIAASREALAPIYPLVRRHAGKGNNIEIEPPDPRAQPPDAPLEAAEEIDRMLAHVEHLSPRAREVITRRYGLITGQPETLAQIGRDLGISREYVRQVQDAAEAKLRRLMEQTVTLSA